MVLCTHQFLRQSPGIWTPDFEVSVIQCCFSHLQGQTLTSFLSILPQSSFGIIYLPGCATVLIYLHLRIICVLISPDVSLCFNLLVSFVVFLCWGWPRISLWLLSVPCSSLLNCYRKKRSEAYFCAENLPAILHAHWEVSAWSCLFAIQ